MVSISYIIPTYNNLKKLKKCVLSIEQQIDENDRLIIVDDGSEDNTFEYFSKKYSKSSNVTILRKENSGQGPARNLGKRYSDTDYVWFVDSDDYIMAESSKNLKKILEKENYDLIFFDYIEDTGNEKRYHSLAINPNDKIELMFTSHFPWNKLIKRNLMEQVDFPNEKIRFQDHGTLPIVISQAKCIGYISEAFYTYVTGHAGNISKQTKKLDDIYRANDILIQNFRENKIKEKEIEAIFINTFVFSKLYLFPTNDFKTIYKHCFKVKKYLDDKLPNWENSIFLKEHQIKKYGHHIRKSKIKLIIGKMYSHNVFITATFLFLISKINDVGKTKK